ncbi:MAG: O-antigen ligase family protein [Sphingomicrobium sp.]
MQLAQHRDNLRLMLLRLAFLCYLVSIVLLAWMKSPQVVAGYDVFPTDLVFLATGCLWLVALGTGQVRLRLHPSFWLLGIYFAALALSAIQSDDPKQSAFKLITQVYLLALPVLTYNLVRTTDDLRQVFTWWIAAAAALATVGVATLLLFPVLGPDPLVWALHRFGTLPPGPYPRLELTFIYPALLANYLGTALMLTLICGRMGWLKRGTAVAAGAAMAATALFALTPGFGGILFMLALWFWYLNREQKPRLAATALAAGLAMPVLTILVSSFSLILHPGAQFLIHIPLLDEPVAPGIRLLLWIQAVQSFLASPIIGHGIGTTWLTVAYAAGDCAVGCTLDAHNSLLNVAIQTGAIGLIALLAIIGFVARHLWVARPQSRRNEIVYGLALAWVSGFVVHGLVGAFEDSRHLWILLGLLLSADSLPGAGRPEGNER